MHSAQIYEGGAEECGGEVAKGCDGGGEGGEGGEWWEGDGEGERYGGYGKGEGKGGCQGEGVEVVKYKLNEEHGR